MKKMAVRTLLPTLLVLLVRLLDPGEAGAQRPERIKIGGTLAITGRFSTDWGPPVRDFMKAWEKLVNNAGGVFVREYNAKLPIELIIYDDESNPDKSVELYEKLAAVDKVHLFLGPSSSPVTLRATTVAERLKIPMLTVEANSPIIYARNFQWIAGVDKPAQYWSDHYFNLIERLNGQKKINYRTIAFLIQDNPHTKDVAEGAIEAAKRTGLEVVSQETVPFPASEFSAAITRFKQANPDMVYVAAWTISAVPFVKQAHELGLKPKQMHVIHMIPEFTRDVGAELAEGVTGETHIARKHLDQRFLALMKQLGVTDPYAFKSLVTPIRYLALETMLRAIEKAGTLDRKKFMESLRTLSFEMPHGPVRFNYNVKLGNRVVNGIGEKYLYAAQIQNGQVQVIAPEKAADAAYQIPSR